MAVRSSMALVASMLVALFGVAQGNAYRGNLRAAGMSNMSAEHIRSTVLKEVMDALGSGNRVTQKRLAGITEVLKPTFMAMPKNEHGNLDDAAARYVLHRLFVQRHAMYIKGLEPGGMALTGTTTTKEVLEEHIPSFVLALFEERLQDTGLSMHELTVLAATLEHLIHDEAVGRLEVVYQAHNMSLDARVSELELQNLIDTYMTIFILGMQQITPESVAAERQAVKATYPGWHDTQKFTVQVRSGVIASNAAEPDFANDNFTFRAATQIVEEIGERYGRWQDSECRDLKGMLTKLEHGSTGQVMLKDFYGSALKGNFQLSESVDFLREQGALEESDAKQMSVVIPNYINAKSNCVASSSIFSVCCIDECEALMAHVERQVAAPESSTDRILEIVAQLPSDTVTAPRELPQDLRSRLEEIASHHGGTVPLHGRLFAQWLHHAYPRECSFPRLAGKERPMSSEEWKEQKGRGVSATRNEMMEVISTHVGPNDEGFVEPQLSWVPEEALVARQQPSARSWIRTAVMFAAAASFFVAMARAVSDALPGSRGGKARDSLLLPYVQKQHAC